MTEATDKAAKIYDGGEEPATWSFYTVEDSYHQKVQENQIKEVESIGEHLKTKPRIVNYHTSKSIKLPVSCFKIKLYDNKKAIIFIRDNFHDIKCSVISDLSVHIPMNRVHKQVTEDWLEDEIRRYRNYTGNPEPTNDEWYSKDWSSGEIIRDDNQIFIASSTHSLYCEGINELGLNPKVFRPYQSGLLMFTIVFSTYKDIAYLLNQIDSMKNTIHRHISISEIHNAGKYYKVGNTAAHRVLREKRLEQAIKEIGCPTIRKILEEIYLLSISKK
jgi:hypothetical protein